MQKVSPLNLILAIFLKPIAAFLPVGLSAHFFLNVLLTLLGGVPRVTHGLWLILKNKSQ
jgi:uncharacterized membrane protein YqaE (UPF0057 family)